MFISDEQVQAAFDVLHDQAHAKTRAAYEFADKRLKQVLARAELAAEGKTVGEREAKALVSTDYDAALIKFRQIAESYYLERDRRDAAVSVIDAWRTQQSDMRAMGRVG